MKKNTLQKVLAVALTGAMAMGTLTGCGDSEPAANSSAPAASSEAPAASSEAPAASSEAASSEAPAASEEAPAAVAGIEGWTAFAENVTLKIPVYDRGVEGVPAVSDNYWTKWIQENFGDKYNITVEFVPITRSDVLTSYALLAAAEDLPTILMEYDYPKQAQWADDGYLTTYDLEAFKQVAPTYYARMEALGQLGYTEMNGETYFALAERPYFNTGHTHITMVRMDWLEQVGYDHIPTTWAEEKEAMLKIKEAGIAEYPYGGAMITGVGSDQNYLYRTFPLDEANWAAYGDYNIPALGDEANKKYLQRENEKYNLGLLNPEYYTIDTETDKAAFINGQTYQYSGYISASMDWLTAFYEQNPDAKLAVKVAQNVVDTEGGSTPAFRADNPFGMMIGFSSQATEDEIKAAWMYMEWMTQEENLFTMQWGIEGENYTVGADGLPVGVSDYDGEYKQGYNNSKDYWCVTIESRNAGTIEDVIKANLPQDLPQNFNDEVIQHYYNRVEIAEAGYAISDCNFAVAIEAVTEYGASLQELYKEYRDQLVMCDPAEFEAKYAELAQQYADAGYQAVVDERLEAYNNGMSTKLPQ